jgi:methionine-rich copper-binding protein CopC
MWRRSGLRSIFVSLVLLVLLAVPVFADMPTPHSFYGTVTIGGSPAPVETEITAVVEGGGGSYTVTVEGQYGNPPFDYLVVAGDIEGGALIEFYVDGAKADQTATFHQGRFTELDLTVPIDITPPEVVSTSPEDGAVDVAIDTVVTATFSEAIDEGSIVFTLDGVSGSVSYSDTTATFTPDADLDYGTTYTASIEASDLAGNPMAEAYTWSFTTTEEDLTPPEVVSTSPEDGAVDVAIDTVVTATFSEAIDEGSIVFTLDGVSGSVSYSDTTATFTPDADLDYGTTYTASIEASDLAGNPMAEAYTWSFSTQELPGTLGLCEGVNIIAYTGATASLPGALTNIGPGGLDVVDIIWARGLWTGGEWLYYNARFQVGTLSQLQADRAYIIVVTEDCTWELPQ